MTENKQLSPDELKTLYRKLYQGMVNQDVALLNLILADDFILTHMTGMKQTKAEWLRAIQQGQMKYLASQEDSIEVSTSANSIGRLQGRNQVDADIWGLRGQWRLQLDLTFVLTDQGLQIYNAVASTY